MLKNATAVFVISMTGMLLAAPTLLMLAGRSTPGPLMSWLEFIVLPVKLQRGMGVASIGMAPAALVSVMYFSRLASN